MKDFMEEQLQDIISIAGAPVVIAVKGVSHHPLPMYSTFCSEVHQPIPKPF